MALETWRRLTIDSIFDAARSQRSARPDYGSADPPRDEIQLRNNVELVDLCCQVDIVFLANLDQIAAPPAVAKRKTQRPIGEQTNGRSPGISREQRLIVENWRAGGVSPL